MKSDLKGFPYPVLGRSNDFVDTDFESTIDFKLASTPGSDVVIAEYNFLLSNDEIRDLIAKGLATYAIDVKCIDTLYREVKYCSGITGSIQFEAGQLYGKTVFEPIVVVLKPVKDFYARDFNPEFGNMKFCLFPGDVIAADDPISKYIEFTKLKFESLIRVETVIDMPSEAYSFNVATDILTIQMGKNFRYIWELYRQEKDKAPFLAMSVYKDCIHSALEFISKNDEEADLFKWARALKVKLETLGLGKDLSPEADFNAIGALAQQLVSKIGVQRLLKNVK